MDPSARAASLLKQTLDSQQDNAVIFIDLKKPRGDMEMYGRKKYTRKMNGIIHNYVPRCVRGVQ